MTPALDVDLTLLKKQTQSFVAVVTKASTVQLGTAIAVFYLNPKVSIALASNAQTQAIADEITAISLQELAKLPISEMLAPNPQITEGAYAEYFADNVANPLVEREKDLMLAEGYDLSKGAWIALPFPSSGAAQGIFFILPKNNQEYQSIKANMDAICKGIEQAMII